MRSRSLSTPGVHISFIGPVSGRLLTFLVAHQLISFADSIAISGFLAAFTLVNDSGTFAPG